MRNSSGADVAKTIFVNRFYWPDCSATSQILTDVAEHLASRDENVVIITSRISYHDAKERFSKYEEKNRVAIYRIWSTRFDRSSLVGRAVDFLSFYLFASVKLLSLVQKGDTIVTKTDPPLIGVFSWAIGRWKSAYIVNWCQDLFPEIATALGIRWFSGPAGALLHRIRNYTLRHSDKNVVVSTSMRDALVYQGVDRDRITVVRNWPDQDIEPIAPEKNSLRQEHNPNSEFMIAYSGNLGRAHLAEEVYELVQVLVGVPGLKMMFFGGGSGMLWLKQQCSREGLNQVSFREHQPRSSLSETLSLPDAHLLSLDIKCQNYLAPSKYYGILAAGRPVVFLGSPSAEIAHEVEQGQFGVVLDAIRPNIWEERIRTLKKDPAKLEQMGRNARMAYESRFARHIPLDQWYQVIDQRPIVAAHDRTSEAA